MQKITDWADLWRELVEIKDRNRRRGGSSATGTDYWSDRAREFNEHVQRRWEKPDSTREFMLSLLDGESTVLDIGAGTGAWAILFANKVKHVTAIDPSKSMLALMRENVDKAGVSNIEIIQAKWPEVDPDVHDYAFCSHAMYGVADFPAFIRHMISHARKMCFLLMRAPAPDGLITEAAQHVWGQPHDSPNFTIGYNILTQMGIYPNVQIENTNKWFFIMSANHAEALAEIKRRLDLRGNDRYDDYLKDLLARRLIKQDDSYLWPGGVQSALVYWNVEQGS